MSKIERPEVLGYLALVAAGLWLLITATRIVLTFHELTVSSMCSFSSDSTTESHSSLLSGVVKKHTRLLSRV